MKNNKEIKKANEEYEYLTGDEAERRIAFLRDKAIRDEKSMRQGERDEGRKEGKIKRNYEIAKKLIEKGVSIEDIVEITELNKEEIEKLDKNQ